MPSISRVRLLARCLATARRADALAALASFGPWVCWCTTIGRRPAAENLVLHATDDDPPTQPQSIPPPCCLVRVTNNHNLPPRLPPPPALSVAVWSGRAAKEQRAARRPLTVGPVRASPVHPPRPPKPRPRITLKPFHAGGESVLPAHDIVPSLVEDEDERATSSGRRPWAQPHWPAPRHGRISLPAWEIESRLLLLPTSPTAQDDDSPRHDAGIPWP